MAIDGPEKSHAETGSIYPEPRPSPCVADYELLQRIGGGSYGEVWLARNIMGTYRAVKVVYRNTFDDARPFEREFAGIKRFEPISRLHESQVDILHVGRNGDCFYYIMELADDQASGQEINPGRYAPKTLRSEMARKGKLPLEDCLEIALSLTTALEHLHQHGLVHRDIKPSNIIFINSSPKLADIGLVTGVEATRSYVGTEGYIPPEGPGTPQADLYGLGKVLYEISTGKDRQDFPEPPIISEGTPDERSFLEFQEVLLKACETDPRRRYQSAKEMGAELELLKGGKSVKRLRQLERRLAVLTRAGLMAGALLILVALAYLLTAHEARRAFREAQRADREAAHAKLAEKDARDRLWEAYLAQAQASRWSGRAGRRFESLEAIRKASQIRPSIELRNEAIACMALPDMRTAREWNGCPPGTTLVAFDHKYERYARADEHGNVSLRRIEDDTEVASFAGSGAPANGTMRFSPDDRFLAVAHGTDILRLEVWDLSKNQVVLHPEGRCRTCEFSPDSRLLAFAEHHGPIHLYDLASGKVLKSFEQGPLPYTLRFHPKGHQLAVSSHASPFVEIRDVETGAVLQSFKHHASVLGLAWNPDGTVLAAACGDANIHVWDVARGKEQTVLSGHQGVVVQVFFNHRGDLLASVGWDGALRLWDALNGHLLVSKPVRAGGFEFSPDDRWLAYMPDQPKLGICEVVGAPACRLLCSQSDATRNPGMCSFSSDGAWLVSSHGDGIRLWQIASGKELAFIPERDAQCAYLLPGGGSLLTSGGAGLKQWPIDALPETGAIQIGPAQIVRDRSMMERFSLTRNGQFAAFAQKGFFHLLDLESRRDRTDFEGEIDCFYAAVSADGKIAAGAQRAGTIVRVWETQSGKVLKDLAVKSVSDLAFKPDGRSFVTTSAQDHRFWDTHSWECLLSIPRATAGDLPGHSAFTQDGRLTALSYSAQSLRLIGTASGRELATLEMPDPQVISWFCFSPDGTQLAVSGRTPVIYIWDLRLIRQQLKAMGLDWEDGN